ncbi:hypothetical protein [Acinetobacter wuhouensis]|uniref:DUF3077 domain-containing protein n=1 Tax=Acinetobacter wuhouensis TaxID=1879050 RepID=A0A4Q7AJR1_9GAMM|nr:hypothetical protein [Acinetobacter wuhouensis]RZG46971.1 hypothetical protein EXU28_07200 [Acinetobacter wuhouensis]
MSTQNTKKPHDLSFGCIKEFYIPRPEANHLNAQDVIHSLLSQAINSSRTTQICFDENDQLAVNPAIVSNLIWTIQTKLEMIEKILPLAFEGDSDEKAVTL